MIDSDPHLPGADKDPFLFSFLAHNEGKLAGSMGVRLDSAVRGLAADDMYRDELDDLQQLLQTALKIVNDAYRPAGANLGMNVGRDAGAGIDGHLHWHVVPRWRGDTNFMPIIGDTKVMIETLEQTWDALQPRFEAALAGR